jgi:RNA polymerase sigma-70 factor (ECF subfamily)
MPAAPTPEWVATLHVHGPLLLAAARAITRDEAEAEDLVQTTFERALRAAPTIRDSRAIRAWLLTVQTREALRVVRRLRRTLRLDPEVHELPIGGPDASESIELDEALGRLSRPIRAAVVLHHMVGLSVRETADALGVTENTAKAGSRPAWRDSGSCSMKTDMRGGAPAEDEATDRLEERLAGRFAIELGRAERDYPALRAGRLRTPEPRRRGIWPRLAVSVTTIGVLAALVVVGVGLAWQPAAPPVAPARSGAVLGADGIPDQIDGQHVYRLAAQGDWQDLSGSFLLGAYAVDAPIPCAPPLPSAQPQGSSENAFVPQCGTVELVPQAQDNSEWFFNLAPRGLDVLTKWLNGPAIVMRVHTHDPGASGCSADQKTACEAAVVVEAVVWSGSNSPSPTPTDAVLAADGIPAQIGGEHVYRLSEALPNGSGSFLLGGYPVNYPISCPSARPLPTAEADLVGQCGGTHLASSAGQSPGSGLFTLAPRGSDLLTPWLGGPAVVIRAHTHDAAAASCWPPAKPRSSSRRSSGQPCRPRSPASASTAPPTRPRSRPRAASCWADR